MAGWWTRDTTSTAPVGGTVNVTFRDQAGAEIGHMDFEMTKLEPRRAAHWSFLDGPPEWLGTHVTFDPAEDGAMTIVNFGDRNWKEPVKFMGHCTTKWGVSLLSLRELVETGTGRPSRENVKIDNWN